MTKYYGIDLGTTHSAIAFINEIGVAAIIPNSDNERITPSVVFFESKDGILVGKIAKAWKETAPDRVVDFVKRQMSDKDWMFAVDGENYNPERISSYILSRLANDANKTAGHEVQDVVITCPPYFGDFERQRTRDAGEIAGLNVIAILDEPVAATINYFSECADNKGKTIMVYDLGGGTFDATVVKIGDDSEKNEICVICTDGTHSLGGHDWDQQIVEYLVQEFQSQTGSSANPLDDPEGVAELWLLAEDVKKALSARESITKRICWDGEKATVELTREKFDEMTTHLLNMTIYFTDRALEMAREQGIAEIDTFLLVGGSTRMLQVRDKLCEKYGLTPGKDLIDSGPDADEMVAKGAAKYAERIIATHENNATIGRAVASKSYGIQVRDIHGKVMVKNYISKCMPLPVEVKDTFMASSDDTRELSLVIYANNETTESSELDICTELGEVNFVFPYKLVSGATIDIRFTLTEYGHLRLFADTTLSVEGKFVPKGKFMPDGTLSENIFDW